MNGESVRKNFLWEKEVYKFLIPLKFLVLWGEIVSDSSHFVGEIVGTPPAGGRGVDGRFPLHERGDWR